MLAQFEDPSRGGEGGNTYGDSSNCSFSPWDTTLLSDGLLWDVRSTKLVHKFDKLSNVGYGVFNPSGNEVIINSAVWDLRTFKLLRVVPALESSRIQFCHTRPLMYVYSPFEPVAAKETSKKLAKNRTWLRVLDTRDYKDVSTVDIERPIYDVALNAQETALGDEEEFGGSESELGGSDEFITTGSSEDGEYSEDDFDEDFEEGDGHLNVQWANLYEGDEDAEGGDDGV
ncbi:hypothetical protein B5M09_001085 [Aphanomyces astaci]|uniref:Uncharacterized protein n=1 Tax=Aphanomyces astaci TaxID=112090 RepID=A0A425DKG7_APHAT|nr:hypothetical protein B5M09_001085 [Aphanomyces astaci]